MTRTVPHESFHKDGTIWARGQTLEGETHGYWEWFRRDGVILRSGHFCKGAQVGDWTTYDKAGNIYKVTRMKTPSEAAAKSPARKAEPTADDFMAELDHPLKEDIEAMRALILAVDPSISDGVKWNSLSFRTTEWFATVNLRSTDKVQIILHLGAKAGKAVAVDAIADPKRLLKWLGQDRATLTVGPGKAIKSGRAAITAVLKSWITFV